MSFMNFWKNYEKWQDECLEEFNNKYTQVYGKREHLDVDEGNFGVEFSEDGNAYVHGINGIQVVPGCVAKWKDSPYYTE